MLNDSALVRLLNPWSFRRGSGLTTAVGPVGRRRARLCGITRGGVGTMRGGDGLGGFAAGAATAYLLAHASHHPPQLHARARARPASAEQPAGARCRGA